jgi:ABC-type dipeptide/oligopeptide/nickel transport system ATPase component
MSALDPQQTPLEAVSETLRALAGRPRDQARAEATEVLTRLGLQSRLGALPRDLSGGEQRRVTLARVLALTPRLIVADEPTSGLEPDRRAAVLRDLFGNLPERAGCILVTHDMSAARAWAHRAFVMLAGRVIEEVDLRAHEPAHPYARTLFDPWGSPPPRGELADTGCPFQPDCPLVNSALAATCAAAPPPLTATADRQRVACYHFTHGNERTRSGEVR